MQLLHIIEQVQAERGNEVPRVALYMAIVLKCGRHTSVREGLNSLVAEKKILWGKTPHTFWFATELSYEDRERINEIPSWTIEQEL